MKNKEWRRCKDPVKMIRALEDIASDRKRLLYLCGGCRFIWHLLYDDHSKTAVEVAERFADGVATEDELYRASYEAEPTLVQLDYDLGSDLWKCHKDSRPGSIANLVRRGVLPEEVLEEVEPKIDPIVKRRLEVAAYLAWGVSTPSTSNRDWFYDYISQIDWPGDWLLRCVFGKPFLPPVNFSPDWKSSTVVSLAEAIYQERAFDGMPILGDALEEVGCINEDVLKHCRSEKPHVRGCWVVDSILGKS